MSSVFEISVIILWIVVIANLFLNFAIIRYVRNNTSSSVNLNMNVLKKGDKIPDVEVNTVDGKNILLSELVGNNLLFFVSPDCEPCREKMSLLQEMHPKAKAQNTEIVVISLGNITETLLLAEKTNLTLPKLTVANDANEAMKSFKLPGTPSFYITDGKYIKSGGILDSQWQNYVQSLLT